MDDEKLLRDAGLNKYESLAYLTLLKGGIFEAGELSRSSKIPMGKIYEVLKTLEDLGFVEVQQSRPKRYRPIEPKLAFDNFYSKKQEDANKEMERLKDVVSRIKEEISYYHNPVHFEKTFWSTIIGEEDLLNKMESFRQEVKEELCIVHPQKISNENRMCGFKNVIHSLHMNMFDLAAKGVRVKVITPSSWILDMIEKSYSLVEDMELKARIPENFEIRILDAPDHFVVMDSHIVLMHLENPIHGGPLGMLRIYDRDFATDARKKFSDLWKDGRVFQLV